MTKEMKRRDVEKALSRHDVYCCPCGRHRFALPRHRTVSPGVVRKATHDLACLTRGWLQ